MSGERGIRRTGFIAGGVAVAMLGLAYASVPLYRLFCQVTGFGGATIRVDENAAPKAVDKVIKVRFDANVAPGLAWTFKPVQTQATIRIGERKMAFYQATNLTDKPITGMATYNVSPDTAGGYFMKIHCFCFDQQTLQPGETVDMPVSYYIDPAILEDASARRIDEITLSYTFFPQEEETNKTAANTAVKAADGTQG
ncbi:cytochrome c oxidase assembly protein [uncultured Sphingosinicella sp.]|jgi:cytochrome c oxidase assembly protein subunit 11|uniref:cytochrome c oxidase assembly protein n=1 Tax=uncultured Sphingosinicella sp. TaxID=478748 RepID=UPI0030DCC65E|tara:strand:- start:97618 stop:98208 length:591 start_codon:yes stop_codon:yes gene_type:complete